MGLRRGWQPYLYSFGWLPHRFEPSNHVRYLKKQRRYLQESVLEAFTAKFGFKSLDDPENSSDDRENLGEGAFIMSIRIKTIALVTLICCISLWLAACATVGRDFPAYRVSEIKVNETSQAQIAEIFGKPWRVGVEDGETTWTYGKYRYRLIGEPSTTDLVVRFNADGVVTSYSFNTTEQ